MDDLNMTTWCELMRRYPYLPDFFEAMALPCPESLETSLEVPAVSFSRLDPVALEQQGLTRDDLPIRLYGFIDAMEEHRRATGADVESLTIIGGHDKDGRAEDLTLELVRGDVASIVGPTGSGKSRLLADIEWLAQGDTPTGRCVLINGETPPHSWRFSLEHKLVAQLSQNMNFVMDVDVGDFVRMHARSRMVADVEDKVMQIIDQANQLAGEPLDMHTPVTALSGGQSRALMIADTAFLSTSPIVLIDEIENAGIDRATAVDLLMGIGKIVLIATHDPELALRADRRIVIRNGGIAKVISSTSAEMDRLKEIEEMEQRLLRYRELLREGKEIV